MHKENRCLEDNMHARYFLTIVFFLPLLTHLIAVLQNIKALVVHFLWFNFICLEKYFLKKKIYFQHKKKQNIEHLLTKRRNVLPMVFGSLAAYFNPEISTLK